jgi:putative phosphoesterase
MTRPRGVVVIGLISDTHGLLRPEVAQAFSGVHLIVHAGDVGGAGVLTALAAIAPVEAVSGNVDDRHDPQLPRERTLPAGALSLHVSHGDELGRPTPERLLARYDADVVVFGHTHRQVFVRDAGGRIAVNPGAAGPRRFDVRPSVARLTIVGREATIEFLPLD